MSRKRTKANEDEIKSIYDMGRDAANIVSKETYSVMPDISSSRIQQLFMAGFYMRLFEIEGFNRLATARSCHGNRDTIKKYINMAKELEAQF